MSDRKWMLHFQHGYSVETSVVVGLLILSLHLRGERSISHDGLFASDPFVSLLLLLLLCSTFLETALTWYDFYLFCWQAKMWLQVTTKRVSSSYQKKN